MPILDLRNSKAFGVFAKQPLAGQVKTRLARMTSPAWAQRVAQASLEDSIDRFRAVSAARSIVYSAADGKSYFKRLANDQFSLVPQTDGDLGQRLQSFFNRCRRQRYRRKVVVGSDSPTLPLEYIEQAFELLRKNDVVIGPALDGGYYLIGGGPRMPAIFDDIPWSSAQVLEKTVARLQATSSRLALLPPWYDVDTVDDWAMLRGHVFAMRCAGIDPGVPRIEALLAETTK